MKNYKKYLTIHKCVIIPVPYVLPEFTEDYPATALSEFTYESSSIRGRAEMKCKPLSRRFKIIWRIMYYANNH